MKIGTIALVNHLAWSYSRQRLFEACERQYYYSYIGSWKGWEPGAPPAARELYAAKHLAGLPAEVGSIVHEAIRDTFDAAIRGRRVVPQEMIERAQIALYHTLIESMDRLKRPLRPEHTRPTRYLRDEIALPFSKDEIDAADARVGELMRDFFEQAVTRSLLDDPRPIIPPLLDPKKPVLSDCLGLPAYIKTDLVFDTPTGYELIDWKTGRESDGHRIQAAVYDLYLRHIREIRPGQTTRVRCIYLGSGKTETHEFCDSEREATLAAIHRGFRMLQAKSHHPTINTGSIADFEPNPGRNCTYCPFQVLCPDSSTRIIDDPNF